MSGGAEDGDLLASDYRVTRSLWVLLLCLLTYDIFLTFDKEVKHFWNGRRGIVQWLFVINRYWPLANLIIDNIILAWANPSHSLCSAWFQWLGYANLPTHLSIGGILVLRLYAIYDCNKLILAVLVALLAVELVSETILIGIASRHFTMAQLPPGFVGCVPMSHRSGVWTYWVPMAVYESLLFLLALRQLVKTARSNSAPSKLCNILLRDSVIYFGGAVAVIFTNLFVWALARSSLFATFLAFGFCFHSIIGCRMLVNIRESVTDLVTDLEMAPLPVVISTGMGSWNEAPLVPSSTPPSLKYIP